MDKNIGKISELVSESWIRRALNSSEVFQQILRIYDSEHQEKLIITILKSLDTTLVQNQSTIYVKGEPAKYAYFIKRGYVSMQTVLGDNIRQLHCYCQGQMFGQSQSINLSKRSYLTRAIQDCTLLYFKVDKIASAFKDYRQKIYPSKLLSFQSSTFFKTFMKRTHIEIVCPFANQVKMLRHQTLYQQGHISSSIYLVIEGELKLEKYCNKTRRYLNVCMIEAGNVLGEIQVVLNIVRQTRAVATSQTCRLYCIGKQMILSTLSAEANQRLLKYAQWKRSQRLNMFQKYSQARVSTEHKLIEMTMKPVQQASSQTTLLRGIDMMVRNKGKSLKQHYNISLKQIIGKPPIKNQFFDFAAGLRPRTLHYRGPKLNKNKSQILKKKQDSKIIDVRKIRKMYQQQYKSLMIEPRLPPILRSQSVPVR